MFVMIEQSSRLFAQSQILPRSNNPARKLPVLVNSGDFVEAVFWPGIFQIFQMVSSRFLTESSGTLKKKKELCRTHRKGSVDFRKS
jgi:hypothetical protein